MSQKRRAYICDISHRQWKRIKWKWMFPVRKGAGRPNQWGIQLEIVVDLADQKSFAVQPCRWVVERTFAWLGRYRRLGKDYEHCTKSSEGMIYVASIYMMLKRLPA